MNRPWRHVVVIATIGLAIAYFLCRNPDVAFRSSDGKWADSEYRTKGRTFEVLVWNFERYKLECASPSATLLRTSPENWFNVFAWPSYELDAKWRVPFSNAHPEVDDYYPPAWEKDCYNNGSSKKVMEQARANAARYLLSLNQRS